MSVFRDRTAEVRRRACAIVSTGAAAAAFMAAVGAGGASAATLVLPPTLAGETLTQASNSVTLFPCHGGSFSSSGVATGPYPGTYTESVSFSDALSSHYGVYRGTVTSYNAVFTITAANGSQITGTETFDTSSTGTNSAYCTDRLVASYHVQTPLTYDAVITTPSGTFSDSGSSAAALDTYYDALAPGAVPNSSFGDSFTSSNGLMPTTLSQCQNGNWAVFGQFSNQGGCVSSLPFSS